MKKICLITPPSPFLADERVFYFIGILKVAAAWEKLGYKIDHIDLCGVQNVEDVLSDYFSSNKDLHFVGLTATSPQYPNAHKVALWIKQNHPELKLVLGGTHATLSHTSYKRELSRGITNGRARRAVEKIMEAFDVLAAGDGELLLDLILATNQGVIDGDDRKSPLFLSDKLLDESPWPARHLIDVNSYNYTIDGVKATNVILQLGCPYKCFTGDTKIITSNSPNKKAKDVKLGDKLIAFNEQTKELVETEVVRLYENVADEIYVIEFEDGTKIETTAEHPFYVNDEWVEARHLRVGHEVYEITPNDKISFNKKMYNPAKRDEVKNKISKTVSKLFEEGVLNSNHLKSETRSEKLKESIKNYWASENCKERKRLSSERMIKNNPMKNQESRKKATETLKRKIASGEIIPYMNTPEYWEKLNVSPNKQEVELLEDLLLEFGHRYEFVGDGSFRIGFYSLDFIDHENKKIIEYNGCWWHGCEKCHPEKISNRDNDRKEKFEKAGYKVHFIKSCEYLNNKNKVLEDLRKFTYNGKKITSMKIEKRQEKVYNFECSPHHNYFAEYLLSHNCTFCSGRNSPSLRVIRSRTTQNAVAELEFLYKEYGFKGFNFFDDELNVNKEMVPLMNAIADLQDKLGVEFKLRGFTKSELFNDEQAKSMYRAGFRMLLTGFESGDPRILENIKKNATIDDNTRCVEIAKKHGLKVKALMSAGHPGESFESIENTKNWLLKVRPEEFDLTVISPYPGAPVYDDAIQENDYFVYRDSKNGDPLYQKEIDYTKEANYYKSIPGSYVSYVWTDKISSEDLVKQRDKIEDEVRAALGIPFNRVDPAKKYEHSMGSSNNVIPSWIYRSSDNAPKEEKKKVSLKVIK